MNPVMFCTSLYSCCTRFAISFTWFASLALAVVPQLGCMKYVSSFMYSSPMPFPNTSSTHATASSYFTFRVGSCGAPARSSFFRMRATSALKSLCLHFSSVYMRPSLNASLYLEFSREPEALAFSRRPGDDSSGL